MQINPWFQKTTDKILLLADLKLPVEIIYFPSCGFTAAIERLSQNPNSLKFEIILLNFSQYEHTNDTMHDRLCVLDLMSRGLGNHLKEEKYTDIVDKSVFDGYRNLIDKKIAEGKKVLVILQYLDSVEVTKVDVFQDFLLFLESYRTRTDGNVNYIFTANRRVVTKNLKLNTPVKKHYFNFYMEKELQESQTQLLNDFNFENATLEERENMFEMTGGLMSIQKAILRDLKINEFELESVAKYKHLRDFDPEQFEYLFFQLKKIVKDMPNEYIVSIQKCLAGENLDNNDKEVVDRYKKLGVIFDKCNFKSPILQDYIFDYKVGIHYQKVVGETDEVKGEVIIREENDRFEISKDISIDRRAYEVFKKNRATGDYLTEIEFKILDLLIQNKGKIVDREQIAKVTWGDNYTIQYSDWAIDKTVSRIRQKIKDAKPYKTILTFKKRGFLFK